MMPAIRLFRSIRHDDATVLGFHIMELGAGGVDLPAFAHRCRRPRGRLFTWIMYSFTVAAFYANANSGAVNKYGPICAYLCYPRDVSAASPLQNPATPRHAAVVRVTHWITVISFFALLISGAEIVISHPRFYWGEVGNVMTHPLFTLPIPASRVTVPTGYGYIVEDQNGWSRSLHFQAAWAVVLTGLVYAIFSLWNGHFRRNLFPAPADRNWRAFRDVIGKYLRRAAPEAAEAYSYNVIQRAAYLTVTFVLFPLAIWTGLAMSPGFDSAFPAAVNALGGRQSARTLHFFVSGFLLLFLLVHVTMIILAGFWSRMRAMITGRVVFPRERT